MTSFDQHPTVLHYKAKGLASLNSDLPKLDAAWLKKLCMDLGADDVGFVDLENGALDDQRELIVSAFPNARSLIAFVRRIGRENLRSPARSAANLEFHQSTNEVNETSHKIVAALEERGIGAFYSAAGFPMEMDRWGIGRTWIISHKPISVAAGLGRMGIHRNVIHPIFGNFILLGTVVIEAEISDYGHPIDYNPCLECRLCVAACPTGAIGTDGSFNFSACSTHNYREFMGGFVDWVENLADSLDGKQYRTIVKDSETVSMWQSLSFGPNYKAAYCIGVCPAGEDVIGQFLEDRNGYVKKVLDPFTDKIETVYVVHGSDAESYVRKRFPHKSVRLVGNGFRPGSAKAFLQMLPVAFQKGQSKGLDATYHFIFKGDEAFNGTVVIRDQMIYVLTGLEGKPTLKIEADSATWLRYIRNDQSLLLAILRGKIRIRGPISSLLAFSRCFPTKKSTSAILKFYKKRT